MNKIKILKIIIYIFVFLLGFFILIGLYRFIAIGPRDYWHCKNNKWEKRGVPIAPKPDYSCGEKETEEQMLDWELLKAIIMGCEAKMVMQTHSLEVTVELKDGRGLYAIEPVIDDVVKVVLEARKKCGEIIIATE